MNIILGLFVFAAFVVSTLYHSETNKALKNVFCAFDVLISQVLFISIFFMFRLEATNTCFLLLLISILLYCNIALLAFTHNDDPTNLIVIDAVWLAIMFFSVLYTTINYTENMSVALRHKNSILIGVFLAVFAVSLYVSSAILDSELLHGFWHVLSASFLTFIGYHLSHRGRREIN